MVVLQTTIGKPIPYLTRKHVSDMFINGELEVEYRDAKSPGWTFQRDDDRERFLQEVVPTTRYSHTPSDGCKKRGDCQYAFCSKYMEVSLLQCYIFQDVVYAIHLMEIGKLHSLTACFL